MPTKKISELDERLNLSSDPSGPYSAIPSPVSATDSEYLSMIARSGVTNQKIDYKNLKWCIKLCLENPRWNLSMQQHKIWDIK